MSLIIDRALVDVPYSVKAVVADFDELRIHGQRVTPVFAQSFDGVMPQQSLPQTVKLLKGRQTIIEVSVMLPITAQYAWVVNKCRVVLSVNGAPAGVTGYREVAYSSQFAIFNLSFVAPADGEYIVSPYIAMDSRKKTNINDSVTTLPAALTLPVNVTVTIWP